MGLSGLKKFFLTALISFVLLPGRVSGCPIPPPPWVTAPDWFYRLYKERPELYEVPKEAIERLERMALNRKLLRKGLMTPEEAQAQGGTAYSGTWKIPVVMGLFNNSGAAPFTRDTLQQEMFDGPWPTGTLKEFYLENSYGEFTFNGTVYDWQQVSKDDTYYEGGSGCNGLCPSAKTGEFIKEILDKLDPTVDFSQYDNDGDGKVEALAVIHPEVDGACGTTNIWAHRWVLSGWLGSPYTTNDGVTINDYIIQGIHCDGTITRIGVLSHELGHILGLPDLYDTDYSSWGLGRWALMGAGSWNGAELGTRPAHMCGWSKTYLGWVVPEEITTNQTGKTILPFETSPTVLRLLDSDEHFLIENRQLEGFDDGLPGSGLLIYHVDDASGSFALNNVNNPENCGFCVSDPDAHYRVAVEQADGLCGLECGTSLGDTGDPFPGSTSNDTFYGSSNPNSLLYDGTRSCVALRNISTSGQDIIADVLVLDLEDPACQNGPDLVSDPAGAFYKGPISKKGGTVVKATLRVENQGNEESTTCSVKTYLSDDAVLDGGDTLMKTKTLKKLKPGKTKKIKLTIKGASSMVGKYLISDIDADGVVVELDEGNNQAVGQIL